MEKIAQRVQCSDMTQKEVKQKLIEFVENNQGKSFAIAFVTEYENFIKDFMLFDQKKIDCISAVQAATPLPDIYFGRPNHHQLSGLEY